MRLVHDKTDWLPKIQELNRACFPSVRASDEKLMRLVNQGEVFITRTSFDELTGFAICEQFVPDEARLVIIAVDEGWRRQGLAQYLVDEIVEFYTLKGATFLSLTVHVDNVSAIRLYEVNDFKKIVRMKKYFLQDGDGFLYRREL